MTRYIKSFKTLYIVLQNVALDQLLLLDIETAPSVAGFDHLPEEMKALWSEKITKTLPDSGIGPESYADRAAIYAEFGKIVCISVGFFYIENGVHHLRIKSFFNDDETVVLTEFLDLITKFAAKYQRFLLCGHNIKEFDIPYICRRALINGMGLPAALQINNFKPWELPVLDTMQLWRFGDFRNYTSLKLLAAVMGIPTPKDDIDGSMVGHVYWQERDLPRIAAYCQKDVLTVAQLVLKFKGLPILKEPEVQFVKY
ncbi:ribonuclease H-like domain-containing protein [Chitinophaga horti]|uniref:Ribonuclease H-like domain-containing protein n=1 Tax=Chitinophaga horti TaxID=2920382 RepID=A0ABY6IW19_9BACT|nr:ribonuclease H-like domain-containing protein [Chitinophaga horti]UYQ91572.1 ribonuclease H-like domain-containing protein [Chitinophaga horti]